ncbi:matrixin family metalloprotease [Prauserella flavalba]|uniref:matrixin family metalloprotease n=1 Tax=Prauserella flavalba TaxID=1477506 RepID=UPI00143D79B7|nr:matrixin family metalloprotease [Prauserella flavalba]
MALALASLVVGSASAETGAAPPGPECPGAGPVHAAELATPVPVADCGLAGRTVTAAQGVGARVPERGMSVTVSALTRTGSIDLTVTNDDGMVSATAEHVGGTQRAAAQADPCAQSSYVLIGGRWNRTLAWWYNASTASRAGLPASTTLSALRWANQNMTLGDNDCGLPTNQFSARGAYQGNHTLYANIDSAGQCTSKFPNNYNTISWGPTDSPEILAITCLAAYVDTGFYAEADIYLASNKGFTDVMPANCIGLVDLESVATHEWGHAFGLDHAFETDLTMYPTYADCDTKQRTLGLGDWQGMNALY